MPIPSPVKYCPMCGDKINGRKDKIFCRPICKAEYHRKRKEQHQPFTLNVDKILHRNWVILTEYYELINKKKFFVNRVELSRRGFNVKYFTTSQTNKKGKTYHYIYNYGWMEFSEKEIMIVRLEKPK